MAERKIFLVKGELVLKQEKRPFSKKVRAKTASFAVEKVLCLFGSKNRIRRNKILVKETQEVKEDAGKEASKRNPKPAD